MSAHTVEKAKGPGPAVPEKLPDPVVKTADALPGAINLPALDLEAVHVLRYRQLQAEAEARENKLLAELEAKQDMLYKKLEESFAQKEKWLVEDLQAKHMAECRRLELVAVDREHVLLVRLGAARRQLYVVIIAAVLAIVAFLNFRASPKEAAQPVLPPSDASGQVSAPESATASLPALAAPEFVFIMPAHVGAKDAAAAVKTTGNGGNFAGGNSSGR
jgi:hypothetical protein